MPPNKKDVTCNNSVKTTENKTEKSKKSSHSKRKDKKRDLSPESEELLSLVPLSNRQTMTIPEGGTDESDRTGALNSDESSESSVTNTSQVTNKKKSQGKSSKKPKKTDEDDDDPNPPGEWEVERIVDIATDKDDRILFRCRWAGFNADEDTWERKNHFVNASALFRGFCEAQKMLLHGNILDGLLQPAIKAINHCLKKKKPDPCLLLRLNGHNVSERTSIHDVSLPAAVKKLRRILQSALSPAIGCLTQTLADGTIKLRDIEYESDLEGMIQISGVLGISPWDLYDVALLYQSRRDKKTYVQLKEYTRKLSEKMSSLLHREVDIQVENLLDSAVPADFEYLAEYDLNGNTEAKPADEFLQCNCIGVCGKECGCNGENERNPPFRLIKNTPTLRSASRQPIYLCTKLCSCKCLVKDVASMCHIPFTIFRTKNRGWGLRARVDIKKGQMVTTYLGQLLNEKQRIDRQNSQDDSQVTYLFDLDFHSDVPTYSIDARFKGNEARFINHSCNPNLTINPIYSDYRKLDCPVLGFFATETIGAGEELTIDYNAISIDEYVIPAHMEKIKQKQEKKRGNATKNRRKSKAHLNDAECTESPPKRFKVCDDDDAVDNENFESHRSSRDENDDNFTQLNLCECRRSNCRGFIF